MNPETVFFLLLIIFVCVFKNIQTQTNICHRNIINNYDVAISLNAHESIETLYDQIININYYNSNVVIIYNLNKEMYDKVKNKKYPKFIIFNPRYSKKAKIGITILNSHISNFLYPIQEILNLKLPINGKFSKLKSPLAAVNIVPKITSEVFLVAGSNLVPFICRVTPSTPFLLASTIFP